MAKKVVKLSEESLRAFQLLKESETPLTILDMKNKGFENANSSHLVALKNRGLVTSEEVEILVPTLVKRKVQIYTLTGEELAE